MKVLMFGWEFPPHISGGLGTACYGITKSLIRQKINVLFVVPRSEGDEEIQMINASNVVVKSSTPSPIKRKNTKSKEEALLLTAVPSSLKAYSLGLSTGASHIQQWNYEFPEHTVAVDVVEGRRYEFTGGYGPSLMDDVNHYGEVAESIARANSFDIIHAHDWLTFPAGIAAKKVSNKPLIVHVHATEFDRAEPANIDNRIVEIERNGMQQADAVIAVSQLTKDSIVAHYQIDPVKVKVIHNGIIPFNETVSTFHPKIANQMITFLGRVTFQKGPEYFIEAARRVKECYPNAHFILAGSGDLLPSLIERVAHLGLSSCFHFTGFLKPERIQQLFSVSDVYVMPSVSEPFGITPLEAIRAGVPVIVSNQSGVSEVLDHVIKVDYWDTEALADRIVNLLRHPALARQLRKNAKRQIRTINWTKAARKIKRLYNELEKQS